MIRTRSAVAKSSAVQGLQLTAGRSMAIWLLYFAIAWAFHAGTTDLFHTLVGGGDSMIIGVASKIWTTSFSSWNPYVELGKFVYADVPVQSFYPPSLLIMSVFPSLFGFNLFLLTQYSFGGFFCFLYLRGIRVSQYAAFVGGLIFMVSGFLTAHRGHEYIVCVAIWLPLILFFVDRYSASWRASYLGFASLGVALCILGGFPQITLYSLTVVLCYIPLSVVASPLITTVRAKIIRITFVVAVVIGLGTLMGSLPLCAVAQALPQLTREHLTYEMFTADYLPPWQALEFFVPNFFGGVNHNILTYATNLNVVELYPYVGLLPLALALAGLGVRRRLSRVALFWIVVGAVALLLALGSTTPIYRALFYLPVYNLFRAPARHLFEVNFAMSIIAAMVLDLLSRHQGHGRRLVRRSVSRAFGFVAIVIVSAMAVAAAVRFGAQVLSLPVFSGLDGVSLNYYYTFAAARVAIIKNLAPDGATLMIPLLFLALSGLLLWSLLRSRLRPAIMLAIPVVIIADTYLAEYQIYVYPDMSVISRTNSRPEINWLRDRHFDPIHYRIYPVDMGLTWSYPLLNTLYKLPVINDYSPIELKRYYAVTGFTASGGLPWPSMANYKVFSILGTQYLLTESDFNKDVLNKVVIDTASMSGKSLIDSSDARWTTYLASRSNYVSYILTSSDGKSVSLIQRDCPIKQNTYYEISFEARSVGDLMRTPLNVDLYALPSYVSAATTRSFFVLNRDFTHYSAVFDSGPSAPPEAAVRLYTQSPVPVEVRNIQVRELGGSPPRAFVPLGGVAAGISIFQNPYALPRFRFVRHVAPARDLDDALRQMGAADFNPARDAIAEGVPASMEVSGGTILSEKLENTRLEWNVATEGRSFFVVADAFFSGWRAVVDGKQAPIYPVYGCLRGVEVDRAGKHRIVMQFAPWSLYAGSAGTGFGLVLFGLLLIDGRRGTTNKWLSVLAIDRIPSSRPSK